MWCLFGAFLQFCTVLIVCCDNINTKRTCLLTSSPTLSPSVQRSTVPSDLPSAVPSDLPSARPSTLPSDLPSFYPSMAPSTIPSTEPSVVPSIIPSTTISTTMPSMKPSMTPSIITPSISSSIPPSSCDNNMDGKIRKVQVFILLGQSNMVGLGKVDGLDRTQYPFLVDDDDNWKDEICVVDSDIVQKRVRNLFVMGSGNTPLIDKNDDQMKVNEWITVKDKALIGPEIGIGYELSTMSTRSKDADVDDNNDCGDGNKEPIILLLKSCIGNRALGWDLLPPTSESFVYTEYDTRNKIENVWQYAGYGDSPER